MNCSILVCELNRDGVYHFCVWHNTVCYSCEQHRRSGGCRCINALEPLSYTKDWNNVSDNLKVWLRKSCLSHTFQQRIVYILWVIRIIINDASTFKRYLKEINLNDFMINNSADIFASKGVFDELLGTLEIMYSYDRPCLHDEPLQQVLASRKVTFPNEAHKFINLPHLFYNALHHALLIRQSPFAEAIEIPDFAFDASHRSSQDSLVCLGCHHRFLDFKQMRAHFDKPAGQACRQACPDSKTCHVCQRWFTSAHALRVHIAKSADCKNCVIISL